MRDGCWRASHYGRVYAALVASLEMPTRNVAPGTHGAIGRAIDHFRAAADGGDTIALLERISITIAALQSALHRGDDCAAGQARRALDRHARDWLFAAPMFPDPLAGSQSSHAA